MVASNPASTSSNVNFTNKPLISCEKLIETTNYNTWATIGQLWFQDQGHADHLTTQVKDIPTSEQARWKKVYTSLCNVF